MKFRSKVIDKRIINSETIVLCLEKGDLTFTAGQYIILSLPNEKEAREYSVYNGENEKSIEILIKTLSEGTFSVKLGDLNLGDSINIEGPNGFFIMRKDEIETKKHIFVASGTGISPFRSYIQTYPEMDYHLLHGIRTKDDITEPNNYPTKNITYCISREESEHYHGRVTNYLLDNGINKKAIYHLCGNSEMINDVSDLLEKNGISPKDIRTEAFF